MNTNQLDDDIPTPLILSCINGDLEQLIEIIENDREDINLTIYNGMTALDITIKSFFNMNYNLDGNITPKYWNNPYIKIILYLTKCGIKYDSENVHLCLFNDKPIFTINDFYNIITSYENKYPIHNSLEIGYLCGINALKYDCYKKEYLHLQDLFNKFGVEILDRCRNIEEAKEVVLLNKFGKNTIDIALEIENKEFIAHKFIQTVFEEEWNGSTHKLDISKKLLYTLCPCLLNDLEWYNNPCIKYFLHTFFNFIFLFLLFIQTNTLTYIKPNNIEYIIFIWIMGLFIVEIEQISKIGFTRYLSDNWNKCDMFMLSNYTLIITIRIIIYFIYNSTDEPYILLLSEHLLVLNIILSFIRILSIFQIHCVLGPILLMIGKMIKDMLLFFCILSVFIVGFILGLTKIYHRLGTHHDLGTISKTSLILFCALFGDFDIDSFKVEEYPEIEVFGITIFSIYLMISVIILINLFIAILSNTYSVIQEESDTEWKYARVCLIKTYNMYTKTPPPINIIEYIIRLFTNKAKQIEPYRLDSPENNFQTTLNIVKKYNDQPIEILTSNSIIDLQMKINNLNNNIDLLVSHLSLSPLPSP